MHAPRPYSVAGQWGAERRKQSSLMCTSSSRDDYGMHNKHEAERASRNPFARFKGLQDSNPMILTFNERTTHMDCLQQEGIKNEDPQMTTTARAMNEWCESSLQKAKGRRFTSSMRSNDESEDSSNSFPSRVRNSLVGEKLSLVDEPSKNTLVQRSWLYSDDPCLMYRINGLPAQRSENETVEYGGLNTRRHVVSTRHSDHGRRAVVTGDILTRTGSSRAGTFLDDYDRIKKDQNENNSNKYYAHEVPYNSYDCNKNYDNNMTYQYGINSIRSGSS